MERLTNKAWRNFDPWECCGQDKYCQRGCHDPGGCTKGCIVPQLSARLGAYEDTGLTPEEVLPKDKADEIALKLMRLADLESICSYTRLRELAEADKDGRLVVPPCKAGDTVYEVTSRKTISEYRVKAIRVELFCTFIEWDIVAGFVDKSIFGVPVDEIGKTVFLTHEEAEKALEAKKDE
jgi:hypothetical protein|nr:MAG TPA: hypothetical protein [Caudoviricetes sp.]